MKGVPTVGQASERRAQMTAGGIMAFWWKVFMASLLCLFFLSCISHFAQYYQLTVDQDDSRKLRKRLPNAVKLELTSPVRHINAAVVLFALLGLKAVT